MFRGTRIRESTSTGELAEALEYFANRIDQIRSANVYGLRTDRTFRAAATKFLEENQHKRSLADDAMLLRQLDPNLAASEWRDEQGLTWLEYAPKIKLLKVTDGRPPYPLSRQEQAVLFRELPDHLARMALFKVNTGCREQEVCGLRWDYEVRVPELGTSVFIIPGSRVKNGDDRLVVLNRVARSIIDAHRGLDPQYVFTNCPRARKAKPGEPQAAPVRKPTHYSAAELANLIAASEKALGEIAPKTPSYHRFSRERSA